MSIDKFNVTYEIITEKSAEDGETSEAGFICENVGLREALGEICGAGGDVTAVEADEWPVVNPRWVTIYNSPDPYTGEQENRSVHFPQSITPASARRVVRLVEAK